MVNSYRISNYCDSNRYRDSWKCDNFRKEAIKKGLPVLNVGYESHFYLNTK